jgi:hypothetical protein
VKEKLLERTAHTLRLEIDTKLPFEPLVEALDGLTEVGPTAIACLREFLKEVRTVTIQREELGLMCRLLRTERL